ncbi:TOMM precursor leader peptide-binding protein [Streptomyces sp. NPDC018031]|uniref:TOMM precursor leader peptide-binding protein n=1 Tax=Streptomyces sp. NPDC018031 TaxID=3365033 RepID=UPI0037ABF8B7
MGTLRFAPHLRVEPVPGEAVYLVSERGVTALHGRPVAVLAPLLDGTREPAEVLAAAAPEVPPGTAAQVIARLRAAGLVQETETADGPAPGPPEAFWSLAGLAPPAAPPAPGTAHADRTPRTGAVSATPAGARALPPEPSAHCAPPAGSPPPAGTRAAPPGAMPGPTTTASPGGTPGRAAGAGDRSPAAARPDAVATVVLGSTDPADARAALGAAGLRPVPDPAGAALTLVVCDDYLDPRLADLDAGQRAAGRRWLPVKPVGTEIWLGPFLGDPAGPCWSCLADRLWRGRRAEAHLLTRLGRPAPVARPVAALPASRAAALHLAALQAAGWLAGHRHPDQAALRVLDCLAPDGRRHPVRRRPQCPVCGDPDLVARRVRSPLDLSPGGAAAGPALTPRQLLDRYAHLVSPVTGLVTEIRRDPRGPEALNCFHARYRPPPLVPSAPAGAEPSPPSGTGGLDGVRAGLRAAAHGKGMSAEQATAAALCEALEHHSGHHHGDEPRQRARYRDLGPEEAVHPDAVQLYDPRQFADRDRWNAEHAPRHRVCDPFDETAEIDWTPVWSLTAGRHRLLPTALLYYDVPQPPGRRYCVANSNGAAAGGSPADAVVRGFLELVERDAVALWWYNRTRQPGLPLDPADPAYGDSAAPGALGESDRRWIDRVRDLHAGLHREVWALDLTTDLGIPVVVALSRRTDGAAEDVVMGFGAHFHRGTALLRALAELNQMLPPLVGVRAEENAPPGHSGRGSAPEHRVAAGAAGYDVADRHALHWYRTATVAGLPYLTADPAAVHIRTAGAAGSAPFRPFDGSAQQLAAVGDLVRRLGMELLVLDQTRPDAGLPVMKVVVPGLRPHWARFAPGRLFDTPVQLGRISVPTAYQDINPVPLFL